MIRKILTPIDVDGESSEFVIRYAMEFSNVFGAKQIYFHPYTLPNTHTSSSIDGWAGYAPPQMLLDRKEVKKNQFNQFIKKIPDTTNHHYDYISQPGMAADLVNYQADEHKVDLIVMGTNEAIGIEEFIGTAAEKITRKSSCPVIVIPRNRQYHPIKKICLAIDPDHSINEDDLSSLLLITKGFNTHLDILHVQTTENEVDESQDSLFKQLKIQMEKYQIQYTFSTVKSTDVERGIVDFTEQNNIDLLTLVYREHGFFKRMFNPGLREKLIHQSELPLLILN